MAQTGDRALRLDLLIYLVSLVFAAVSAAWSEFYGYRVWGNFATAGYLIATVLTLYSLATHRQNRVLRSRWTPVAVAGTLGAVVPMLVLVFVRAPSFVWGAWPWSFPAQPEVWVVERSARLLLDNGTPYPDLSELARAAHPDDYTPYGPSMIVYGLPRALFGDGALTDARVAFLVAGALIILLALRVLGWPKVAVRAAQLAAVSPLTLLTLTVAGDDVPVIALIVLATALAYRANPVWAGIVCAVVITTKLTALPALAVLAVAIAAHRGWRAVSVFLGAVAGAGAVITVPVLLVDPRSFVEHVILFPAGLGEAKSPAASPLPGHLIAGLGPAGHTAALALLAAAACAIVVWLLVRPPQDPAGAVQRIAISLGTAIVLAPATRWGYLVYPLALFGAMLAFSASQADTPERGGAIRKAAGPTTDAVTGPDARESQT
jgi:glycosyl transferase family 87